MENLKKLDVPVRGSSTPRILYIITRAERGGAQSHVLDLAGAMRGGFEVAVATGEEGFLTEACRDSNISFYVVKHLRRQISPIADIRALGEICKLVRSFKPDLIHAHTSKAGILGRLAGHLLGIPSIYTIHGAHFGKPKFSGFWRFIGSPCERLAANWSARLITVCHEGRRLARNCRIGDPSKVVTIHNGIEDNLERANPTADHPLIITMVARFCEPKDHNLLLRAFADLPLGPRLRLVGGGPLQESSGLLAHELGIFDRVDFLGDRDDVASLLASSDVFVLATNFEMLPISILEAMRAGLPVIASQVGGISEVVIDGETGLLVPCSSVSALTQALTRVVEDFDLRVTLGRAARRRFSEEFLFARQVELTRSLYMEVLEAGKKVCSEVRSLGSPQTTGRVSIEP